jgi:uncharacterized membrane protein
VGGTIARDPLGNSLAVITLAAMIFSMGGAIIFFRKAPVSHKLRTAINPGWGWLIPVLCLIGLTAAGYLVYMETAQVEAACGPVGDYNIVQQSRYARLFSVLPIGILGVIGHVLIRLTWTVTHYARQRLVVYDSITLFGLTTFGMLFSIYLTFLEPFVISATCAWRLTSAIIMTGLFWLSLAPTKDALFYLHRSNISG